MSNVFSLPAATPLQKTRIWIMTGQPLTAQIFHSDAGFLRIDTFSALGPDLSIAG